MQFGGDRIFLFSLIVFPDKTETLGQSKMGFVKIGVINFLFKFYGPLVIDFGLLRFILLQRNITESQQDFMFGYFIATQGFH